MASLDSLPADHRAVLQLVLQRGRSYDDIAQMLSIDRAAVRERALAALDALGPQTTVAPERRALITDYLLGQLPSRVSQDTRDRLAEAPTERAWARVVASELTPLASGNLPEIPTEATRREPVDSPSAPPSGGPPSRPEPVTTPAGEAPRPERVPGPPAPPRMSPARAGATGRPAGPGPRSSRTGGALLLAGAALVGVIVVVVLVIVLSSGGSSNSSPSTTAASASPTSTSSAATTTATSSSGTATAKPIAQVNLLSPTGGQAKGVAIIVKQGATTGLVVRATGVPANTRHNAYAVWLYNSASDNKILGFVNPGVGTTQVLQTAGPLPANASHFKQLLVSVETVPKPKAPSTIVLQGALNLH